MPKFQEEWVLDHQTWINVHGLGSRKTGVNCDDSNSYQTLKHLSCFLVVYDTKIPLIDDLWRFPYKERDMFNKCLSN